MGNALEFILKLTDQLSPAIKQAQRISDSATGQIERQFNNLQTSGKRMSASVDELRSRLDGINKVRFSTTIEKEFDTATRAARRLESEISTLESKGSKGAGSGGGIMGMIGGLLPGIGIVGGIGKAITASADAEMSRRSFGTLLGNQGQGNKLYADINKFGNETVLDNAGIAKNAQTLLAFGTAGDKIMPTLRMLGDVSMGDQQRMESLTLAFAQVGSAGKLGGQDLLQFINAGFNPLNEISKMTGLSLVDLKKKMEDGSISADLVTKAFQHATTNGGMFHNALANAGNTVLGKWGNLMGTVHTKLVAVGDFLSPVTKMVIDFGGALIDNGPALAMIASGIGLIAVATGGWSAAQGVLNFIMNMNPIVRIVSLILILGGIIYTLIKSYDGWGKSLQGLWEIIKGFGALALNAFKTMGEGIVYWLEYAWLKTKSFFQWIGGAVANVATALKLAVQFDFEGAKKALTANISISATKDLSDLETRYKAGQIASQQAGQAAIKQIAAGWGMMGIHKAAGGSGSSSDQQNTSGGGGTGNDTLTLKPGKAKADSINSGGQRSIVINVGKMIDKMEVHVMNSKEASAEIEDAVRQALRKVMYNLNEAQPQ